MGNVTAEVFARVIAKKRGRAYVTRATSALSPDPPRAFAIAPIQVVAEQRVQAVAYGDPEGEPQVITLWNPLDREVGAFEPFAAALDNYFTSSLAEGQLPRVWVAHGAALKLLGLMGERYRRNQGTSDPIRRLGWLCHKLAVEHGFAGQQVVAVAADLLRAHLVTGQSPAEDQHLGALLAWINPELGEDPAGVADRRALRPAAAMLDRETDDRVEELRRKAKGEGPEAIVARGEIEVQLLAGALNEWGLLVEARTAFRSLGLPPVSGLEVLEKESARRIEWPVTNDYNPPSRPHSLARRLDDLEYALDLAADVDVRGDERAREAARQAGRVVRVEVIGVAQPRPKFHPCTLTLRTAQSVLRVRRGTELETLDGKVKGRVTAVRHEAGALTLIELKVTGGVRAGDYLKVGAVYDVTNGGIYDGRVKRREVYRILKEAEPPLVYGRELPDDRPRRLPAGDLLKAVEELRGK